MNYRKLGSSGLRLSELSLGAWVTYGGQVGEEVAVKCMSAAHDAGVNFFDNAEAYAHGNAETVMGNAIKRLGWRRESIVVSSKVFWGGDGPNDKGLSKKHVYEACRNSLRRLQLNYLDLFFCHRPDSNTPIEETVRAMDDLIHQGLILYWGTSEWSAADIMRAYGIARELGLTPPTMEQPQYNMLHRERVQERYPSWLASYGGRVWLAKGESDNPRKYCESKSAGANRKRLGLQYGAVRTGLVPEKPTREHCNVRGQPTRTSGREHESNRCGRQTGLWNNGTD